MFSLAVVQNFIKLSNYKKSSAQWYLYFIIICQQTN